MKSLICIGELCVLYGEDSYSVHWAIHCTNTDILYIVVISCSPYSLYGGAYIFLL